MGARNGRKVIGDGSFFRERVRQSQMKFHRVIRHGNGTLIYKLKRTENGESAEDAFSEEK